MRPGPTLAVVVGVRPQYVKLAALQRAITVTPSADGVRWVFIDAGQHYDPELAARVHAEYGLRLDRSLGCARPGDRTVDVLARMLVACHDVLTELAPSGCVVMGDANVSYAAARAAHQSGLPLAHLEAGGRSLSRRTEDLNRHAIDSIATLHLASSRTDLTALCADGRAATSRFTGDLLVDLCAEVAAETINEAAGSPRWTAPEEHLVVALHHAETLADTSRLGRLVDQIDACVRGLGLRAVMLQHPHTAQVMRSAGIEVPRSWRVHTGLAHRQTLRMLRDSAAVITDSGGLQRECVQLGRRAVVVQREPFWPALVALGVNVAVPPDSEVEGSVERALEQVIKPWEGTVDEFGGPDVAGATVGVLEEWARGCR